MYGRMKLHNILNLLLFATFGCFVVCVEYGFPKILALLTDILAVCIFSVSSFAIGKNVIFLNLTQDTEKSTMLKYAFWSTVSLVYIIRQTINFIQ